MTRGLNRTTIKKYAFGCLLSCLLIGAPNTVLWAATNSANLQWAANSESDLAGYRVYHGVSPSVYDGSTNVGKTTTYQYVNLQSNKTHYFAVTAYDTSGNESSPSSEVSKTIGETSVSSLAVSVTGSGTVSSTPGGLSCSNGSSCSASFTQGSSVTLNAAPMNGYLFSGWGGACSGTSPCSIVLTASSVAVSANFAPLSPNSTQSLSVTVAGSGEGSVTSTPSGLSCSAGTCTASFPHGTTVTLTPNQSNGSQFEGWNGVCEGILTCSLTLSTSKVVTATFSSNDSENPNPLPSLPIRVNFQASDAIIPSNFQKDDGSPFAETRGYGWSQVIDGVERNSTAHQTLDTFVSVPNQHSGIWNFSIPNGTYYVTLVIGDPTQAQGPHWITAEGLELANQVLTAEGEYLTIVDYPVEISDNSLSIKLGGPSQGQTVLNYLLINSAPNLPSTTFTLTESFGSTRVASDSNAGSATKVKPEELVQKEEKDKNKKMVALDSEDSDESRLDKIKSNISGRRGSGESVTIQNLLRDE